MVYDLLATERFFLGTQHTNQPTKALYCYVRVEGDILYYYVEQKTRISCFHLKNKQEAEVLHLLQITN